MTQSEIDKSDNELIAEFMNGVHHQHIEIDLLATRPDGTRVYSGSEFKYNKSWDWLMPVVQKIDSLHSKFPLEVSEISEYTIFAKIDVVYKAVVEFIKWYNSHNNGK